MPTIGRGLGNLNRYKPARAPLRLYFKPVVNSSNDPPDGLYVICCSVKELQTDWEIFPSTDRNIWKHLHNT